jgi:hypothetical protein
VIQPAAAFSDEPRKTPLLDNTVLEAITRTASGLLAKDTVTALGRFHRVQGSSGYHDAAELIAARARQYGLSDVKIEAFPADGTTTYHSFRSYYGWEAEVGVLTEVAPRHELVADYSQLAVALADYSNDSDVTAELVDAGAGTSDADYDGKDVRGRIVLAGGLVAQVHQQAVEKRGAAGVLSYQANQTTGWSGDLQDNVRWGHLSPYNLKNTFAFMISLRQARSFQERLRTGEAIRLHAVVKARMKAAAFEVVTATIPGTDPEAGEVVFSCHLCHQKPGANDNASGAAAILEDARILATLIDTGVLPRPRRTIRFIWPPEISGTMCYLARHPEVVARMRAAIHMDMVGGDFGITKAVLHLTRTPASLPSAVSDVAAAFGEYVIAGSHRAAADGDFSDAILSPEGSKDPLIAEVAPFSMGSDHDVYLEGSYRIPTIYINDWPDVFIHTNSDTPANIDATKMRRVAVIGACCGYFLASARRQEAELLALEVFSRGAARQAAAAQRAVTGGISGPVTLEKFHSAQDIVHEAERQELEALASVQQFAPGDARIAGLIETLQEKVRVRARDGLAMVHRFVPVPAAVVPADPLASLVPRRTAVVGGMQVYYYDYILDHLGAPAPGDELVQYETLNLVDGRRSTREIITILSSAYRPVKDDDVVSYLRVLERAGVVTIGTR